VQFISGIFYVVTAIIGRPRADVYDAGGSGSSNSRNPEDNITNVIFGHDLGVVS
jgi:hypothetical protein